MATSTWSTPIEHSSDATFRTWGQEFHDKLAAIGTITQASDTGQINWTTVTRPGINTNGGYEIWYLNDAMHSTAPIYIRFDFGTAGAVDRPRIQVTVGTGTNGAGTITGTASTGAVTITAATAGAAATNRDSYLCCKSGFFGILHKTATTGTIPTSFLVINRTCDADGTPNGHGAMICWGGNTGYVGVRCLRFAATAAARTSNLGTNPSYNSILPYSFSSGGSTQVGSDYQVTLVVGDYPEMYPQFGLVGYRAAELSLGTSFSATTVGSTSRTYLALTSNMLFTTGWHIPSTSGIQAMLWE